MRLFPKKPTSPGPSARRKLEAAVARRASRASMIEDDDEPTTSFKTALIVVLLLHVVAGGGILMFDQIKTRRLSNSGTEAPAKTAFQRSAVPASVRPKPSVATEPVEAAEKSAPLAASTPATPAAPAAPVARAATPTYATPAAHAPVASGSSYIVAKGDKLMTIARKFHVNYDDLLKLNKIEDPKKLRIGQKLSIPAKPRASTK